MVLGRRTLGQSLQVSAVGLGCMPMTGNSSGDYGAADEEEAVATIHRAIDCGVTWEAAAPLGATAGNRYQPDGMKMVRL